MSGVARHRARTRRLANITTEDEQAEAPYGASTGEGAREGDLYARGNESGTPSGEDTIPIPGPSTQPVREPEVAWNNNPHPWAGIPFKLQLPTPAEFLSSYKSGPVEDWLRTVRRYMQGVGLKEEQMIFYAQNLLKGEAKIWFDYRTKKDEHALDNWMTFSTELKQRFKDLNQDTRAYEKFAKLRQGNNIRNYNQVFMETWTKIEDEMDEKAAVQFYILSLKPSTKQVVQLKDCLTLADAMSAAENAEMILRDNFQGRTRYLSPAVRIKREESPAPILNYTRTEDDERRKSQDARRRRDGACYGCGEKGHLRRDCPRRQGK